MTTHDLTDPLDGWRAATADDLRNFLEVPRAKQAGTDDSQETSIVLAPVVEAMDDAAPNEQRLTHVKIDLLPANREAGDTLEAKSGFVKVVVTVRRRHTGLSRCEALKDGDTPTGLIRINVEDHAQSTHLNSLSRRA